ncbi:hypothetical protein NEDG_00646 [Nematocida displodere]|uniref:Uncharacterized protein n=1 Tax=Nematocida displodere TaxID=1805483 RepID=A0A177EC29_9MICR|nr:hypothetical protein NEDG_00646 [Nematocida displodere]
MKYLMEQWSSPYIAEVYGERLFSLLGLIERSEKGYSLIHTYNATYLILLRAQTEYIYQRYTTNEEECKEQETEAILKLHKYNRTKDTAQEILGILAQRSNASLKKTAQKYSTPEALD